MTKLFEEGFTPEQKKEPACPSFACVTIGFTRLGNELHMVRTFDNLWMIPVEDRPRYLSIIDRYSKENLERVVKNHDIKTTEAMGYCLAITFTAEHVENLWNVSEWVLWESQTEDTAPNIIGRWAKEELQSLLTANLPVPKYHHLHNAMKENPRIVLRTSAVTVDGKKQFLSLCANNCRPYIVNRWRVSVTDRFMWDIEKKDVSELIAGLKRRDPRDCRLAWGLADTIEEAQTICKDKADIIWKRVGIKKSAPFFTTLGIKDTSHA